MLDSFPYQFIRKVTVEIQCLPVIQLSCREEQNQTLHLVLEIAYEWLQVASLLWEKLGTCLQNLAKGLENNATLHFLLNHKILKFVLHGFI